MEVVVHVACGEEKSENYICEEFAVFYLGDEVCVMCQEVEVKEVE